MAGNKRWSTDEIEYLEKNYRDNDIVKMISFLKRSEHAIHWKASQMGILQRDGKQRKASYKKVIAFTKEHHLFLKKSKNNSHIVRLALDLYIKLNKK